jgi:hypothetical protein
MLMLDRRMLLRAGSAAVGAAALAPTTPALAHAPQAGERAQPSFYRLKLGAIEITVVSDGTLAFPAETLWGDRAEDARGLLTSRMVKKLIRPEDLDHCHPSWFLIGKRAGHASDDLRSQLVSCAVGRSHQQGVHFGMGRIS